MRLQKGISRQEAPALDEIETERDAERDKMRNRNRNRLGPPRSCWHMSEDAEVAVRGSHTYRLWGTVL